MIVGLVVIMFMLLGIFVMLFFINDVLHRILRELQEGHDIYLYNGSGDPSELN